jgi:TetR/AcrR family transcriptional repressor of nem operon
MSRPKLYDRETVLEKATNLFWEKGFEASSLNELEARTGINKYSIYNEFGNKDKLFLACMDTNLEIRINCFLRVWTIF